ncbi:MAG: PH domain-containing protein [Acetatifactor sp.]|nr:PH domain-containing protein [Acetatifactor sp.]
MRSDVEAALKEYNIKTFGNKKNLERVEGLFGPTEKVIYISPTNAVIKSVNINKTESLPGIFALTNERILFSFKAGFEESMETFSLSEIKSVNSFGNGISGGHIEIHTMTKTIDILVSYKKEAMQQVVNAIRNAQNSFNTSGGSSDLSQIESLHDLLQKGIITQEEFDAKKKQLLGI